MDALLLQALPKEVQNKIITYSYNLPPKALRNDLLHYHDSFNQVCAIYRYFATPYSHPSNPDNYWKTWLCNDLIRYMNNDIPIIYRISEKLHCIIGRILDHQPEKLVPFLKAIIKSTKYNRLLWGMLTIQEREEFITQYADAKF
jgi:hypothetical protein